LQKGTVWLPSIGLVHEVEEIMQAKYKLVRVQLDAMWSYVDHKGEKVDISKSLIQAVSGEAQQ
jgi:hypothetical protein